MLVNMSAVLTNAKYYIERIDGREIEKPTPKKLHARLQAALLRELFKHELIDLEVLPNLDVLIGNGDWLVPDIVLCRRDAKYENGMLAESPPLAVEIISPDQTLGNLLDKCERLHRAGTEMCWVLWPEKSRAWTFTSGGVPEVAECLSFDKIDILVAPLFSGLD